MSTVQTNPAAAEALAMADTTVSGGLWRDVWKRFKSNPIAITGFYVVCVLAFMALFADFLANDKPYYLRYSEKTYFPIFRSYMVGAGLGHWPPELLNVDFKKLDGAQALFPPVPYRPTNINLLEPLEPPSRKHWLGTDKLGRDVMAGMIHGSRISLSIGFVAVGIAVIIGLVLGAIAGYFAGWMDLVISRLFEIMLSIPTFFLLITVAALLPPSIFLTMAIIGATSWVGIARFTRNEFLRIRSQDYVTSAIALGVANRKVMFKHILPNALGPGHCLRRARHRRCDSGGVESELPRHRRACRAGHLGFYFTGSQYHDFCLVARGVSWLCHFHHRARLLSCRGRLARGS